MYSYVWCCIVMYMCAASKALHQHSGVVTVGHWGLLGRWLSLWTLIIVTMNNYWNMSVSACLFPLLYYPQPAKPHGLRRPGCVWDFPSDKPSKLPDTHQKKGLTDEGGRHTMCPAQSFFFLPSLITATFRDLLNPTIGMAWAEADWEDCEAARHSTGEIPSHSHS